mgnify:CR=1 FL=1
MKKVFLLGAMACALVMMTACKNKNESVYQGIWGFYNKAEITLYEDSLASIAIWSADFDGHFRDKMSGVFNIADDSVLIFHWTEIGKRNKVYNNPPYIDTLFVRNDTLFNHSEKGYFILTPQ